MKYKIEKQIIVDNPNYGALGDDFSFEEIEALNIIINKIEDVLFERTTVENIYGNICYRINVSMEKCSIYCYNEFLGEEPTIEIHNMFNDYRRSLLDSDSNMT
jgi:hypothetical protein